MGRATAVQRILARLAVATCLALLAAPAVRADTSIPDYTRYALLRERLLSCQLDRTIRHLSYEDRRACRRLERRYVLFALAGAGLSQDLYIHCLTRRCPTTPDGNPRADRPLPRGATVVR